MRFSVIIPVHNEKDVVSQCIEAILSQDYPKEDFEVLVVNDGSTDGTKEVVEKYPVRLINLEKNMGRIVAREVGAKEAKYDTLLFVDSRYVIHGKDFLKKIAEIGYQPLFPIAIEEKYGSPFNTLFYLIRKKWYKPYYPFDEYPREFWIEEENFDMVPKGMSVALINKSLFLSSVPNDKGKMINDDTRLLWEVVKKKKILRHSDVKVFYLQRTGFWEVIRHIYERGPRFADYYLISGGRYCNLYLIGLPMVFAWFLLSALFNQEILMAGILGLFVANASVAIWLSGNIRDFFIVLIFLPAIAISFGLGILKGVFKSGSPKQRHHEERL